MLFYTQSAFYTRQPVFYTVFRVYTQSVVRDPFLILAFSNYSRPTETFSTGKNISRPEKIFLVRPKISHSIKTRDYEEREHIPVPNDSFFQSILNFAPCCESYFSSHSHGYAANDQRIKCHKGHS